MNFSWGSRYSLFLGVLVLMLVLCLLVPYTVKDVYQQSTRMALDTLDHGLARTLNAMNITSPGAYSMIHKENLPPDLDITLGRWLLAQQKSVREEFERLKRKQLAPDDPEVIAHARSVILPPAKHKTVKLNLGARETPQSKAALEILKNKRGGFFLECGATNGERASNTIFMEHDRGWTGLLIEVDPYFFLQLIGHNRKSYSLNACLSPHKRIDTLQFKESFGGLGAVADKGAGYPVPCYPLETLLRAINVTKVDFISLDVEGQEVPILKTIPFDKIDITVLAVETAHGGSAKAYDDYMATQGYVNYKHITFTDVKVGLYVDDTMFVKKSYLEANGMLKGSR